MDIAVKLAFTRVRESLARLGKTAKALPPVRDPRARSGLALAHTPSSPLLIWRSARHSSERNHRHPAAKGGAIRVPSGCSSPNRSPNPLEAWGAKSQGVSCRTADRDHCPQSSLVTRASTSVRHLSRFAFISSFRKALLSTGIVREPSSSDSCSRKAAAGTPKKRFVHSRRA